MSRAEGDRRSRSCAAGSGPGRRAGASPRTMFDFSPKSTIPIERPAFGRGADVHDRRRRDLADEVLVLPARHGPGAIDGGVAIDERRAPSRSRGGCRRRRWRASARVSTPAIAGIPFVAEERRRAGGRRRGPRPSRWRRRAPGATAGATGRRRSSAAVVADQRVGHDDDLAGVRRVGADLLVAGLRGVDDEVAAGGDRRRRTRSRGTRSRPRARGAPARGRRPGGRRSRWLGAAAAGGRRRRRGRPIDVDHRPLT